MEGGNGGGGGIMRNFDSLAAECRKIEGPCQSRPYFSVVIELREVSECKRLFV